MDSVSEASAVPAAARSARVWWIALGGLASLLMAPGVLPLVRDRLHILCDTYPPGTEGAGSWSCPDGIGYLGIAVAVGAMTILLTVAGCVVAGSVRSDRDRRAFLAAIAIAGAGWALVVTWNGSLPFVSSAPSGASTVDDWNAVVGPAAIAGAAGAACSALSVVVRGRAARVCAGAAVACFIVATVLQPGLASGTVLAAAVMVTASLTHDRSEAGVRPGEDRRSQRGRRVPAR